MLYDDYFLRNWEFYKKKWVNGILWENPQNGENPMAAIIFTRPMVSRTWTNKLYYLQHFDECPLIWDQPQYSTSNGL